jgi:hypothetical protein
MLLLAVMFVNVIKVIAYLDTETYGFDTLDQQSLARGNDSALEVTYPITDSDLVLIPVVASEARRCIFNVGTVCFDYQTTEQIILHQDNADSVYSVTGAAGVYRLRFYKDGGVLRSYFEKG